MDFKPDLAILSEANIFSENLDHELHIPGYTIILPDTMDSLNYYRLAVLVKEGTQVTVLNEYMDQEIVSIWLNVNKRGGRKLHIGAVYRQHHLLRQPTPNATGGMEHQKDRWQKFLNQWKAAGETTKCFVIGDTNLSMNKGNTANHENREMTRMTKNQVELLGFYQFVRGNTQFWPGTNDSLVDQCWNNTPLKAASIKNVTRTRSDHNLIEVVIRMKGVHHYPKEILAIARGNMSHELLKEKMEELDWTELYECENVDIANTIF